MVTPTHRSQVCDNVRAFALVLALLCAALVTTPALAQTLQVLHAFTGDQDGGQPFAGLTFDQRGFLYGTTLSGYFGYGMVFEMKPSNGQWLFQTLHTFRGGPNDGAGPAGGVTIGPNGTVYVLTYGGGNNPSCPDGCGTVYNVRPPQTACKTALCDWAGGILYAFQGGADGSSPSANPLFDSAGNLYGTTNRGGPSNYGTVFKLTHSGGTWAESIIYSFSGPDGVGPEGLAWDAAGNLYGSAEAGGNNNGGTVYQLVPSGGGWVENTLYKFASLDVGLPSPVTLDPAGNIYGSTSNGQGTIWELSPSGGQWIYSLLENFGSSQLTVDAVGNLYGITWAGGSHQLGSIFKLTPSNGGWIFTDLYDFQDRDDGALPTGKLLLDRQGNIYGTASTGGAYGWGTVWELTP
jgi:uncharacterized repeat protein (TIGR03803 family)